VSIVKSDASPIMFDPLRPITQSVLPATSLIRTSSPTLGDAGSVRVTVAAFR